MQIGGASGSALSVTTPSAALIEGPNRQPERVDLIVLDSLRGIAAVYVMLGHAVGFLWAGYANFPDFISTHPGGIAYAAAVLVHGLLRWGHQAVLLFFLLSGFCVHYRQANTLAKQQLRGGARHLAFDVGSYARRRFRRLYPPLLVALGATALLDSLGHQVNPAFYDGLGIFRGVDALFGNLLLQASFSVPAFGSNGPLWSLAFEFWFYALYPVMLFVSVRLGAWRCLFVTAVISAIAFALLPFSLPEPGSRHMAFQDGWLPWWVLLVLGYWVTWVLGAFIADAYTGRIRLPGLRMFALLALGGLVVLAINLALFVARDGWWRFNDLLWGAGFGILLAALLVALPTRAVPVAERAAQYAARAGDISYSLYIVHVPWLTFLSAWWLSTHERLPNSAALLATGIASALVLAYCCWYFVERHCVSRPAERRTHRRPRATSSMQPLREASSPLMSFGDSSSA